MLVPRNWMEEYVPGGAGAEDAAERMVLSGSNIDSVKEYGDGSVEGIVLGRLEKVWPHPDSDHLVLCLADVGAGEALQIVTGAANVKTGDYVPVAVHGAVLPGGVKIKKGKLRGEVSDGMLCSAQELGFDDKVVPLACKDGIWVLPEEFKEERLLGSDIFEVLGLENAEVFEFEITPNRPDCLAVHGLAAEYAAVYDMPLLPVETLDPEAAGADYPAGRRAEDVIKVGIAKPEHCCRYIARVAENVVIKESPWWMQKKLMLAGMRPINNIVDITNYVMLETGHPIHAFDVREIAGGEINVDTAEEGEKFTTLDETERVLTKDMLLIKDGTRGVAIAGVMGGLNSEIRDDTTAILIEAASFSPDSVRKTSKKLGLRTESSARFEKGVPAELSKIANDRVCKLIAETRAGTVLAGAADCYPVKQELKRIEVRTARVNAVLGTELSADEMARILGRLGIAAELTKEGDLTCEPPFTRIDLIEEIDIVEEIARIYGYEALGSTLHADSTEAVVSKSWALRDILRDVFTGFGLSEIQTYSFVSPAGVALIGAEEDKDKNAFVKLLNPLGEENSVMRTTLLPGLIEALARNYNHSAKDCRLFEIGTVFKNYINDEGLPTETLSLCMGVYGDGADFFFLKGCVVKLFQKYGLGEPVLEPVTDNPTFHPGRCARISLPQHSGDGSRCVAEEKTEHRGDGSRCVTEDKTEDLSPLGSATQREPSPLWCCGVIGELHPDVAERFDLGARACCAELDFTALAEAADMNRDYIPIAKYPAVLRDIALLADDETPVGVILGIIRQRGGRILEKAELFDIYRGKQVPEGKKSLAFSLVFRDREKTLTDEDAQKAMKKILKGLEEETGAVLRDT